MDVGNWITILLFVFGFLLSIIGWFIVSKLTSIQKDITKLYTMHHQDETALGELKVKIAENYPVKADLRIMVQDIKDYFDERFRVVEQIARTSHKD